MSFLDDLRQVVGERHLLSEGDLSAWVLDWRRRYRGRALAVALPRTTTEVVAIIQACAKEGVAVVAQGGNTGLVGGSVPDASGSQLVLNLSRMNQIREFDVTNLTMTVDAGCTLQAVQETAAAQGLIFPLSMASEGSCTIGGNLATNAGGTQVLRFGAARDLCLGLEVVTAKGDVWDGLSGLRKDNTGYDLRDLFIGSEGTLGIITGASLKLFPRPVAVMTAMASVATLDSAVRVLQRAQARLGPSLTGFEVMGDAALALVRRHFSNLVQPLPPAPWVLLLEQSDTESESHARVLLEGLLEAALEAREISDTVVAERLDHSRAMWHLREAIPLAQAKEGLNIKHDISLPVSRIPAFVASTDAALRSAFAGVRLINYGHLGDGNLHYNVQAPPHVAPETFLRDYEAAINTLVYDAVIAHDGSISAEHGIGALKRDELAARKSPVALDMMRSIKAALDPKGLMNPGRVL